MSFRKLTAACLCAAALTMTFSVNAQEAPITLSPATSTIAKLASMGQMKFGEFPVDQAEINSASNFLMNRAQQYGIPMSRDQSLIALGYISGQLGVLMQLPSEAAHHVPNAAAPAAPVQAAPITPSMPQAQTPAPEQAAPQVQPMPQVQPAPLTQPMPQAPATGQSAPMPPDAIPTIQVPMMGGMMMVPQTVAPQAPIQQNTAPAQNAPAQQQ
ncbi:serine/threonine protein kinase [Parasutterella muris]|uniref:Serine/threonine protein kinase n=1 Tax=Parasutterella muris TaxID=2565572 RepID=A0A6L6YEP5_9BURK|nr:serine/threonine protein kinase [Parasutterella muris]MVX56165.1 serine/threonine protein kinase [Parasutterella muris]